jgi:hypothetical protein
MIRYTAYLTEYEGNRAYKMQYLYNRNTYEQFCYKIICEIWAFMTAIIKTAVL